MTHYLFKPNYICLTKRICMALNTALASFLLVATQVLDVTSFKTNIINAGLAMAPHFE